MENIAVRPPERLKVMTLNVRQPDQDDGVNAWEHRRELLVDTILSAGPDLIGTQELFELQAEYIIERAAEYEWFGAGRFGDGRDKHVGIFYRKESLRLLEHGNFWLSETPEVAGSSSWDIVRPRQVTWGHFATPEGVDFHHFNTHFPYRREEQQARRNTAALLLRRSAGHENVLITGDFNSAAEGEIHQALSEHFEDAWLRSGKRSGGEGTLHGFGKHSSSRRIDWILYRAHWKVLNAATLVVSRDGVYPSDHHPVVAEFDLAGSHLPAAELEAIPSATHDTNVPEPVNASAHAPSE